MKKIAALIAFGLLGTGTSFSAVVTLDYVTPFTASSGIGVPFFPQFGEVITVPNGVDQLDSFSLVFFDAAGTSVYGKVDTWTGSGIGANLFTSSLALSSGIPTVVPGYENYVYAPPAPIAVTPGQQLLLSLYDPTLQTFGNLGFFSADEYAGGYFTFETGGTFATFWNPEDVAFSATFESSQVTTPEPGTLLLMGTGLLMAGTFLRRKTRA